MKASCLTASHCQRYPCPAILIGEKFLYEKIEILANHEVPDSESLYEEQVDTGEDTAQSVLGLVVWARWLA